MRSASRTLGLAISYKLFCRDDLDLFTQCNGLENHAHIHALYTGTVAGAAAMDGVERKTNWITRDLTLPTPRLGGTGTDTYASHLATGDYVLSVADTLDHVRFAATPGGPLSGQIDLTVNVQRNRATANPPDRTFDVVAHVTFSDSGAAALVLDSSQNYTITLSTGAVVKN